MANDSLLKRFLSEEEKNLDDDAYIQQLREYLYAYKEKYSYDSVFLVSTKTNRYYHFNGLNRVLTPGYFENKWYYDFLEKDEEYSLNVDNDEASDNIVTVFVNCKIKDDDGETIGVIGVGLKVNYIQALLKEYDEKFDIKAKLIDSNGKIQFSSIETGYEDVNLFDNSFYLGFKDIILKNKTNKQNFWYPSDHNKGFVVTQYVPNLKWYLIVENDMSTIKQQFDIQFSTGFIIIVLIILLVLITITNVIKKYNAQLVKLAIYDPLTDIFNRIYYEQIMEKYNKNLNLFTKIGIGIFDLNGLKNVNDVYGHHVGDEYIKNSCKFICNSFTDYEISRIGGDEFAIIFKNIDEEDIIDMYENMIKNIEQFNIDKEIKVSMAFGYSFYDSEKDSTLEGTFLRADKNMYNKKQEMKGM